MMQAAETRKEMPSRKKAKEVPPRLISEAPRAGPMMPAICPLRMVRELALGREDSLTMTGTRAV